MTIYEKITLITAFTILVSLLTSFIPIKARDAFIKINNYAKKTENSKVRLQLQGPEDVEKMRLAKNDENINNQRWISYGEEKNFYLDDDYGEQEVRVQFKDEQDDKSRIYSDTIFFNRQGSTEIRLDNDAKYTSDRNVEVEIIPPEGAVEMRIANTPDLSESEWKSIDREFSWQLSEGYGEKEVSIQFKKSNKGVSSRFSDKIYYRKDPTFSINGKEGETNSRLVELDITLPKGYKQIKVSNSNNFSTARTIENPNQIQWLLTENEGYKSVFVKFIAENNSKVVEKSINFNSNYDIPSGIVVTSKNYSWQPYYLGFDRKLHPFSSTKIFHSWYDGFSEVKIFDSGELSKFPIGLNICTKAGSWLVKLDSPQIYIPQEGCKLRPIRSTVEAHLGYGNNWNQRVVSLSKKSRRTAPYFKINFSVAQPANNVYDKDQDGISAAQELNFSTSDQNSDSDQDGLSDFEEIKVFNSNPTKQDSNNNGIKDSKDIIAGKSPIFKNSNLSMNNNYFLPPQSLIKQDKFYYRHFGKTLSANPNKLNENKLGRKFSLTPPYQINIKTKQELDTSPYIVYPTIYKNGSLTFY